MENIEPYDIDEEKDISEVIKAEIHIKCDLTGAAKINLDKININLCLSCKQNENF